MARKALITASNYWGSPIQVGDHHLARQFARDGWDVAFVSHPITPLHLLRPADADLGPRWRIYRRRGIVDADGRLWAYVPGALFSPFGRGPLASSWALRAWHRFTWPRLRRLVERRGFGEVDLLYLRDPRQAFWLDAVRHRSSVYRIADHDAALPNRTPALAAAEAAVARRVDVVVYTARTLAPYVRRLQPRRMELLSNGVDYAHFARDDFAPPEEYRSIPQPIALYVGSIHEWFDYDLVAACAEALPDVSFVLIGPGEWARSRLPRRDNLHVLGPRSYAEVPRYMYHARVGIIPFAVHRYPALVNSVNPLKIHEYLASGIPVVATSWEELRAMALPVHLCEGTAAFIAGLRAALSREQDRATLRACARGADWSSVYSRLRQIVGDAGPALAAPVPEQP